MFETHTANSVTTTSNPSADGESTNDHDTAPFASLDLSRPVTVYDSSIDPMALHILQKAFESFTDPSHEVFVHRLIPKFALIYGTSISHPSLQRAIVLYCAPMWNEFSSADKIAQLRRSACQALGRRLKRPDVLEEGDLFASFLVACHFYKSGSDEQSYTKGFFAVARRLFDAADTKITNSPFQLFWRMLIYDFSGWSRLDGSTLIPQGSKFRLIPSHYGRWRQALDLPLSSLDEKQNPVIVSHSYFATVKAIYKETPMLELEENDLRTIKDIKAHLTNTDELYAYWCFDFYVVEYWKLHAHSAVAWFSDLLNYNWCCLLISILPPSSDNLNFPIVAATRVFTFFSRIEYSVDQHEVSLVNEEHVLALLGTDAMQESDDPLLVQSKLPLTP